MLPRRFQVRRGLTLMELIVVLVILVGLAGILIPVFPSMISRTHTSSSATNTSELTKNIQVFEATYYQYPNQYDSLLGTGGTALFTKLPGGSGTPVPDPGLATQIAPLPLTAAHLTALNAAGITQVWDLLDTTTAPTFNPYGATPRTLAVGDNLVSINATGATALNLNTLETYVILGVGRKCTAVGRTISDPPVHFTDDPNNNPTLSYGRVCVIFQLTTNGGTTPLPRAKLVGSSSIHPDTLSGGDAHLQEYYESNGSP